MRKVFIFILVLFTVCFLHGCERRKECLNYENFDEFYYNNNLYILPSNYDDIVADYRFYGKKHKVGYTIGSYNKTFETYVLDNDVEENILFQKYSYYFWFKEGFQFPDLTKTNITKLLIEKLDSKGYIIMEKEFMLGNIMLDNLLVEYDSSSIFDFALLDTNNFLTYRIKYIYADSIITNRSNRITFYNNNTFIEVFNNSEERKIFMLNEKYSEKLYEFVLKNFN